MTVMTPRVIAQPAAELLTIEECRAHLNIEPYEVDSDGEGTHPDDDLIMEMQGAAREHCENFTGLTLAPRTYEVAMDSFPVGAISLTLPPLLEVQSITYQVPDSDGDPEDVLLDPSEYVVSVFSSRVVPLTAWPAMTAATDAVRIIYLAGTSETGPLPKAIRAAMLLMLTHLYENRGDSSAQVPVAVETLLRPQRVLLGMA